MDKIELEIKQDENTIIDFAEYLEIVSNTNKVTIEEILQKIVAKDVITNKMITVAVQIFNEYEKESDNSNQMIKGYNDYIGDKIIKSYKLEKVCGDNVKEICSEEDEVYKINSNNRYFKILNYTERELQSNKKILWKSYQ